MTQAFATGTIENGVITLTPVDASLLWDASWDFGATAAEDGLSLREMLSDLAETSEEYDDDAAVMGYSAAQWAICQNIDELQLQPQQYEQ